MKKFKILGIITMVVSMNSSLVFAHSGRTDSNGGHYNRSTGVYHYHNGGSSTKSSSTSTSTSTSTSKSTSSKSTSTAQPKVRYTNLTVNGESVAFDTKPFIDENGRTMVPIAKIAEIFNATTEFDEATNTVTIKTADTTVVIKIGEKTMLVNGETVTMDTKAVISNGRTFVPVSAMAKAFNAGYTWDSSTSTVNITIK